jgi:hypothetical protein
MICQFHHVSQSGVDGAKKHVHRENVTEQPDTEQSLEDGSGGLYETKRQVAGDIICA